MDKATAIARLDLLLEALDKLPSPTRIDVATGTVAEILGQPGDQYALHLDIDLVIWLTAQEPFRSGSAWERLRILKEQAMGNNISIDLPGVSIRAIHSILKGD